MHAQNCLFLALECSNRTHSDLDKLMEALFFISGRLPGLQAAWPGTAPSPGAGLQGPASAPSQAGGVGGSSAGRSHSPRLLAQERLVPAEGQAALLN